MSLYLPFFYIFLQKGAITKETAITSREKTKNSRDSVDDAADVAKCYDHELYNNTHISLLM